MQPITVSVGPLGAATPDSLAASQTVSGAAFVVLSATTVSPAQRIGITSGGNDSAVTFTVIGTTYGGQPATEVIQGTNGGVAVSVLDYETVISIKTSGSTSASGIEVGTVESAGSRWVRLDSWANAETSIQVNVSGTVNYTVQVTMDDPNSPTNPVAIQNVAWLNTNDADVVSAISNKFSNFQFTPTFARVVLNTGSGTITGTFAQANVVNR